MVTGLFWSARKIRQGVLPPSEAPLHQPPHQIGAALLEAGQLLGLQTAHGETGHLIDMAAELVSELARGRGAAASDHGSGRELEHPFNKRVTAVDQQHVMVGQARQPLLHQGSHVVEAAHLFGQQDQGCRGTHP